MGFLSQAGHIGIRTQASKGTFADPGAVAPNQGVFVRTRGGAMSGDRELLIPDPEIGGNRDVPDALLGPIKFSGDFDIYGRGEALPTFLKGVLGAGSSAGAAGTGYTHTLLPADTVPWLSIEEQIANSYMVFKYTDAVVNTFHLEADSKGYLMGTAGLIALTQATTTATLAAAQRWDTSPMYVGSNIVVTYNSVQLPAKTFSLDVNNNFEDDDFRLGSLFLGDLTPKRREVTIGCTIRPQDATLWKQATWGAPAATAPGGLTTKQQVVITITSYEDIPGATAGIKYVTTITIPKAIIKPYGLNVNGDDVLQHDMEIQAVRPDPTVDLLTATVKNSFATVA